MPHIEPREIARDWDERSSLNFDHVYLTFLMYICITYKKQNSTRALHWIAILDLWIWEKPDCQGTNLREKLVLHNFPFLVTWLELGPRVSYLSSPPPPSSICTGRVNLYFPAVKIVWKNVFFYWNLAAAEFQSGAIRNIKFSPGARSPLIKQRGGKASVQCCGWRFWDLIAAHCTVLVFW